MEAVSLLTIAKPSEATAIKLDRFQEEQTASTRQQVQLITNKVDTISHIVQQVCTNVNERAQQSHTGVAIDQLANSKFAQHLLGTEGRSKSMVAIRKERAERAKRLEHARQEKEMLINFIRLVDHLQVEKLVSVCFTAVDRFYAQLEDKEINTKQASFFTDISFNPLALIEYKPPLQEFVTVFQSVITSKFPRFLCRFVSFLFFTSVN